MSGVVAIPTCFARRSWGRSRVGGCGARWGGGGPRHVLSILGEALAANGPAPPVDLVAARDLRCLGWTPSAPRPLPGRRQLQGVTAVRSRRLRCGRIVRGLNAQPGRQSLVGVGSAQEGYGQTPRRARVDPEGVATRSRARSNLVAVCRSDAAGTVRPCRPTCRSRPRQSHRFRRPTRCHRPIRFRLTSRTRSRRRSSDPIARARAAHGRAGSHVQM